MIDKYRSWIVKNILFRCDCLCSIGEVTVSDKDEVFYNVYRTCNTSFPGLYFKLSDFVEFIDKLKDFEKGSISIADRDGAILEFSKDDKIKYVDITTYKNSKFQNKSTKGSFSKILKKPKFTSSICLAKEEWDKLYKELLGIKELDQDYQTKQ